MANKAFKSYKIELGGNTLDADWAISGSDTRGGTPRSLWVCDDKGSLPTTAEGVISGDWAFETENGTAWKFVTSAWVSTETAPSFMEHFFGLAIDATNGIIGSNSTGTTGDDIPFAIVADGLGGTAQVATGTDANAGAIVSGPISFKPSTMGPVWMETRAKVVGTTTATDGDFYIGFGDARTYTSDLPYVISAAGATTTGVPTEGAFIGYTSVTQTSGPIFAAHGDGTLFVLTSKTGTDTVTGTTSAVTKDSDYHVYRVEISTAGVVTAYIDGTLQATVSAAITAATALSPQLSIVTKAAHENTLTIDYIAAGGGFD